MSKKKKAYGPSTPTAECNLVAKAASLKISVFNDGHHWRFDDTDELIGGVAHFWPSSRLIRFSDGTTADAIHMTDKQAVQHVVSRLRDKASEGSGPLPMTTRIAQTARAVYIAAVANQVRAILDTGEPGPDSRLDALADMAFDAARSFEAKVADAIEAQKKLDDAAAAFKRSNRNGFDDLRDGYRDI